MNEFTHKVPQSELGEITNGGGPVAVFEALPVAYEVHIARNDEGYLVIPVAGMPDAPMPDAVDVVCFTGGLEQETWFAATRRGAELAWAEMATV